MPYCSKCGTQVRDNDRFCAKCGASINPLPNFNHDAIYKSKLIKPDLPIVREYNDKYDNSPSDVVFKAYAQGDIVAAYDLACRYEVGEEQGVACDEIKAISLFFEVLQKQNNSRAFRHIGGLIAFDGVYGENRMSEGIPYLEAALELGDGIAAQSLGMLYKTGSIVPCDTKKALEYYQKAVDLGEDSAWNFIGEIYFEQEKYAEAKDCYEKSMDAENVKYAAAVQLGLIYEFGAEGIDKNLDKARQYYELAYDNKDKDEMAGEDATFQLAKFLFKEKSGKAEDARAFELFSEDMNNGYQRSNSYLGYYYWKGIPGTVAPNIELAIKLLSDVDGPDKTDAAYWLGMLYYEDLHNKEKAISYLAEAANAGHEGAQQFLNKLNGSNNHQTISDDSKPLQMIEQAREKLNSDLHGAKAIIQEAYQLYPEHEKVIFFCGLITAIDLSCLWGIGAEGSSNAKEACELLFELAAKLRKKNYEMEYANRFESSAHCGMGRYYYDNGNLDAALKELKLTDVLLNPYAAFVIYDIHVTLAQSVDRSIEKEFVADVELLKKALNSTHFKNDREKCLVYIALYAQYSMGTKYVPQNVNYAYDCVKKAYELCPDIAEEELSHFSTDSRGNLVYNPD